MFRSIISTSEAHPNGSIVYRPFEHFPYGCIAGASSSKRRFPTGMTKRETWQLYTYEKNALAAATITAMNGNSIRFIVMPDSGADACAFPLSLAQLLKLDIANLPKAFTGGAGSKNNTTYYDTVTIDPGYGIVFQAYAGFTAGMDSIGFGLLGQEGFFSQHNVEFRHADKIFTVAPV